MAQGQRRTRRARGWVVETLEGRALLSAASLTAHAHPVAERAAIHAAAATTITGKLSGAAAMTTNPMLNTQFNAGGQVARVGQVFVAGTQLTYVGAKKISVLNGSATFVLPTGRITVVYNGTAPLIAKGNAPLSLAGSITGGTGAYATAKGTFTGTATFTDAGKFGLTFTLRLT